MSLPGGGSCRKPGYPRFAGIHPRAPDVATDHPFTPVCSRAAFLATPACGEIVRRLDEGLGDREPFLVVTGDPGTGKTTLAREVISRWGELVAVAFLAYSAVGEVELLEEIVRRFGIGAALGCSACCRSAC